MDKRTTITIAALILTVCSVLGASVRLAWDANSESDLAGYISHTGTNHGGPYPRSQDVGNVTTTTVSNLVEGVTYYFVVTAYNTSGLESEPSNEVSYTVASTSTWTTVPSKPQQPILSWPNS